MKISSLYCAMCNNMPKATHFLIKINHHCWFICLNVISCERISPGVACWTSDHWVTGSNQFIGMFHHSFYLIAPALAWPSLD